MSSRLSILLVLSAVLVSGCGSKTPTGPTSTNGPVRAGDNIAVNYGLWLFSDTAAQNKGTFLQAGSFSFVVGAGQVVKGFDQGVVGMMVGDLKHLVIPPELGYGGNPPAGSGIPVDATLVFDVQLLGISR